MNLDFKKDYLALELNPEYSNVLHGISPTKRAQEVALVSKIMNLLNRKTYSSIDELYDKNTDIDTFVKNSFEIPITHFGYNESPLTNDDYRIIIENIKNIIKQKHSLNTKSITNTQIDNVEFSAMKTDENTHFISSSNNKTNEQKLQEIQSTNPLFQTINPEENTKNTFKEIEKTNDGLRLQNLSDIRVDILSTEEKEIYDFALNYQMIYPEPIQVDLKKGVIVDKNNKILKIVKNDGVLKVINNENKVDEYQDAVQDNIKKETQEPYVPDEQINTVEGINQNTNENIATAVSKPSIPIAKTLPIDTDTYTNDSNIFETNTSLINEVETQDQTANNNSDELKEQISQNANSNIQNPTESIPTVDDNQNTLNDSEQTTIENYNVIDENIQDNEMSLNHEGFQKQLIINTNNNVN